jgi:hypothetical protein
MSNPSTEKAKQLAEDFSDFVNSYGHNTDAFIEAFSRQHRTLQQSMMRVMLATIEHVSSDNYHTDGRNEQSKDVAKKLISGFKKELAIEQQGMFLTEERLQDYVNSEYCTPSRFLGTI